MYFCKTKWTLNTKETDLYVVFVDPFYEYSEDKFANSLKGYLKDVSAVLELYRASQVVIHPDESILVKQSSWTKILLKQDSFNQLYADKIRIYVDNEVVYYLNLSFNLTTCIQYYNPSWKRNVFEQVNDVLKFPYHANLERLLNRRSVEHYNADETRILKTSYRLASASLFPISDSFFFSFSFLSFLWSDSWLFVWHRSCNLANQETLKLAVGDFNLCQSIHNKELKQLSRYIFLLVLLYKCLGSYYVLYSGLKSWGIWVPLFMLPW